jgi:hypothetical protein
MIYNLTVTADPALNGRVTPSATGTLNFPNGFLKGDKLVANQTVVANSMTWYNITSCLRNGNPVLLPNPVWAGAGTSGQFLRVDSTQNDPTPQPPAEVQPIMVSAGVTQDKTVVVEVIEPNGLPVEKVTVVSAGVSSEYIKKP